MVKAATAGALEIEFAEFLDAWAACWRYEPRWPTEECATGGSPQFRVWLPLLHPGRRKLGKAFFVELRSRSGFVQAGHADLPLYHVEGEATPAGGGNPASGVAFLFRGPDGRVRLRAASRAE
jgi:hypothetical protein